MRIAIHAHVFYAEIWPEIAECIDNLISVCGRSNATLVVTYPEGRDDLRRMLGDFESRCECRISPVPNRGYDIGPFLVEFLNKTDLSRYDYIVKLHTKRNTEKIWCHFRPFHGSEWRRALLSFCSSRAAAARTFAALERHSAIGMIASHRVINYSGSDCPSAVKKAGELMRKDMSLSRRHYVMVSGSMFVVRSKLLEFCRAKYSFDDFSPAGKGNLAHKDYGLAGPLEFVFAMGVDAQGFVVSEGHWPPSVAIAGYGLQSVFFRALRFLSDLARNLVGDRLFSCMLDRILK